MKGKQVDSVFMLHKGDKFFSFRLSSQNLCQILKIMYQILTSKKITAPPSTSPLSILDSSINVLKRNKVTPEIQGVSRQLT